MNPADEYAARFVPQYSYPYNYSEPVLTVSATPSGTSMIPWLIIAAWLFLSGGRNHF